MNTNLFRALKDLLPDPVLMVATVSAIDATAGTSLVTLPGNQLQTVRGTTVAVGHKAFVRNGLIEGPAPDLPSITLEV